MQKPLLEELVLTREAVQNDPVASPPRRIKDARIALVVAALGAGGVEKVISLLAREWIGRGHTVTVIAFDGDDAPIFHPLGDGVRLVRLDIPARGGGMSGVRASIRRCRALRRTLDALNPDVTLSFLTKVNVVALLACLGTRRRLVIAERNNPRRQAGSRLWNRLLAILSARADAIVMQTRASMVCLGARVRARARVIANPIEVGILPPRQGEPYVLAAVGRLTWQKGFDLLIDAFAVVAARHPDWRLVIWGEGESRADLEVKVAEAGLQHRIAMPGNSLSPEHWLAEADAFVLSSRFEGFSNALCEAMAAGLPVIAFDCDYGPRDIIGAGRNGLLVPDGDVPALASAMDRLMSDARLRDRLGDAARELGENLGPGRIVDAWDNVLHDVISRRR